MEREAEETGRPPETKPTKDRGKTAEPGSRGSPQSGESLHREWENKARKKRRKRGREYGGGIKWTAHERGGRTGEDRGIPRWHLISLSFLLSFSLFPSFFLPINHSDFSLTNSFPAGGKKTVTIFLLSAISLFFLPPSSCLFSLSGLLLSLSLSLSLTHL